MGFASLDSANHRWKTTHGRFNPQMRRADRPVRSYTRGGSRGTPLPTHLRHVSKGQNFQVLVQGAAVQHLEVPADIGGRRQAWPLTPGPQPSPAGWEGLARHATAMLRHSAWTLSLRVTPGGFVLVLPSFFPFGRPHVCHKNLDRTRRRAEKQVALTPPTLRCCSQQQPGWQCVVCVRTSSVQTCTRAARTGSACVSSKASRCMAAPETIPPAPQ